MANLRTKKNIHLKEVLVPDLFLFFYLLYPDLHTDPRGLAYFGSMMFGSEIFNIVIMTSGRTYTRG